MPLVQVPVLLNLQRDGDVRPFMSVPRRRHASNKQDILSILLELSAYIRDITIDGPISSKYREPKQMSMFYSWHLFSPLYCGYHLLLS